MEKMRFYNLFNNSIVGIEVAAKDTKRLMRLHGKDEIQAAVFAHSSRALNPSPAIAFTFP